MGSKRKACSVSWASWAAGSLKDLRGSPKEQLGSPDNDLGTQWRAYVHAGISVTILGSSNLKGQQSGQF